MTLVSTALAWLQVQVKSTSLVYPDGDWVRIEISPFTYRWRGHGRIVTVSMLDGPREWMVYLKAPDDAHRVPLLDDPVPMEQAFREAEACMTTFAWEGCERPTEFEPAAVSDDW